MPDRDPTRNIEFTQIPTAAELMGINTEAYRDALDEASALHDNVFGEVEEPTAADEAELDSLRSQYEMLTQPRPQFAPVGERIQGNEFSVSVRSLSQGLNDLVAGVDRERRRNALFGDPERQEQMRLEAQELDSEAQKLEEQAEKIVGGEIPLDAMTIGTPLIRGEDGLPIESERKKFANRYLERAQELRSESEVMREQLNQYSGVSGQLRSAERDAEEAERESEFERQFKLTFGQQLFETAQQTIKNRADLQSRERREVIRQTEITERARMREQERTRRTIAQMQNVELEDIDASDHTPNAFQHRRIIEGVKYHKRDIDDEIDELMDTHFTDMNAVTGREERVSPSKMIQQARARGDEETARALTEVHGKITDLRQAKQYADRIHLDAIQWRDSEFQGALPPSHPPSEEQERMMRRMEEKNIPQQMIDAWMYYNRIERDAPPVAEPVRVPYRNPGEY